MIFLFAKTDIKKLTENIPELIGDRWMLISAGTPQQYNMMTASWGMMGVLWGKPVAEIFIRPSRYTLNFVEQQDTFALCVFPEALKNPVHGVCGSKSGRDVDKQKEAGLTPIFDQGTVYFEEAELVFICRKIYVDNIRSENFIDSEIEQKWYDNDHHRLFIGEIVDVLKK